MESRKLARDCLFGQMATTLQSTRGKTREGPLGCICYRRHLYESSPFCDAILRDPGVPSYGIVFRHMYLQVFESSCPSHMCTQNSQVVIVLLKIMAQQFQLFDSLTSPQEWINDWRNALVFSYCQVGAMPSIMRLNRLQIVQWSSMKRPYTSQASRGKSWNEDSQLIHAR